jgi:lambda family phage portal protein
MKVTFLDRAIGWVSPVAGARRVLARKHIADTIRSFDGAARGTRGAGWKTSGASANAELGPALNVLRNRSRDLVRNDGHIKHALTVRAANAVGTGIVLKLKNKKAQKAWKKWVKVCDGGGLLDFYGIQAQVWRAVEESGEVLVRFRVRRPSDGLAVPLQLQVLEADYLDALKTGPVDGGFCILGVQFNLIGQRTGYWLFDQHPGEVAQVPKSFVSKFVPASEVIHLFDATQRPGSVRGFPQFAVSIWAAKNSAEYRDAERIRKKVEACFAAFVTTGDPQLRLGTPTTVASAPLDANSQPVRAESLQPGLIEYLLAGEDVKFAAPASSDGYEDAIRVDQREMAAGGDVTYEQMTGDYSQVNFTSGRMGKIDFKRILEQKQWLMFMPMFCNVVADRFLAVAYLAGEIGSTDIDYDWTPPRIEFIDPQREVAGLVAAIEAKLQSRRGTIRLMGEDPDEVDKEIREDPLGPVPAETISETL